MGDHTDSMQPLPNPQCERTPSKPVPEIDPLVLQHLAKSRNWMMAARKRGIYLSQAKETPACPPTTSAEIGRYVASGTANHEEAQGVGDRKYLPIRGTDITRGGEGRSLAAYYGEALA
jgi:hypothetical protein